MFRDLRPNNERPDRSTSFTKASRVAFSPIVANRLESRKSLLGADPGFSQQGQYQDAYNQPASFPHGDTAYTDNSYAHNYQADPYQPQGYAQPTYAENGYMGDEGFAHREGLTSSRAVSTATHDRLGFLKSLWPAAFLAVTGIQALICLGFEAYVFGKFQISVSGHVDQKGPKVSSQYKTIPTFLTLFIFGFLYELVIVWDALRLKNTIQIIGVTIANLALLIYTALQIDQIKKAINILEINGALAQGVTSVELWGDLKAYLIAIPCVIALATLCMAFVTWKLYQEFAWDVLKIIGADYRMKKRFLHYQIYIALLKFDFFFFLGFIIQFVVIVAQKTDPEFALTIATIPITIVILLAAAYFTRKENKPGMVIVIVLYFGGMTYFIFKLVRIYQPHYKAYYEAVQKSLTAFAVITILLIILTIVNAIICMVNFGKGLKGHLQSARRAEQHPETDQFGLQDTKPQLGSRMTID